MFSVLCEMNGRVSKGSSGNSVSSLYTSRRLSSAALPRMTKEPNVSQNKKEHKKNRLRFKTKQSKKKKETKTYPFQWLFLWSALVYSLKTTKQNIKNRWTTFSKLSNATHPLQID